MINITVNNSVHSLQKNTALETLLEIINVSTNGIAVAINQEVVPKENWATTTLKDNDNILIIQATQGG